MGHSRGRWPFNGPARWQLAAYVEPGALIRSMNVPQGRALRLNGVANRDPGGEPNPIGGPLSRPYPESSGMHVGTHPS